MATLKEIQIELEDELRKIDRILTSMGQPSSCLRVEEDKELELVIPRISDVLRVKDQGKCLGTNMRKFQKDLDIEKIKIKEEERQRAIIKLETDIRMEVFFTKIELRKKGFI